MKNPSSACLCILMLCFLQSSLCQKRRIPPWHIRMAQKQGPNTCVVEEIPGTNKKFWTECKYRMHRDICGIKSVIRYECCEGYHQVKGKPGCTGVKPMKSVLETAKDLGATRFVDYVRRAGLAERLHEPGSAVTIFVPSNEAFENMPENRLEAFEDSLFEPGAPQLLYHIIGHKVHSKTFAANMELETLNSGAQLRINRYSNGMMTVNCVPIVRKDQEANNGIIHIIDQVLEPPGPRGHTSIPETILADGRLRELSRTMLQTDLVNELRRSGPFTLLAPFDEAFQQIPPADLARITEDPDARIALLKNHIIPHTICIPAIIETHTMKTLGDTPVEVSCNRSGVYVNGARFAGETLFSSNGVINMIDEVLLPDRVRSMMELINLHPANLSTFASLIHLAGMKSTLLQPNISITVFAPSNHAFSSLPEDELSELRSNEEKLQRLISYHIAQGRIKTNTMSDNQRVDTLDNGSSVRLKVYRKAVGVESAVIQESDIEGQNGVLHVIDRVLTPPERSILEMLGENGQFSTFAEAIKRVKEKEPDFLESRHRPETTFTIFAPTNEAFEQLGEELHSLWNNSRRLKKIIQNHIVDNMISSRSFRSKYSYDVRTEYQTVHVQKKRGNLMVNNAHIVAPDNVMKDGIVHCIDQVLLPDGRKH